MPFGQIFTSQITKISHDSITQHEFSQQPQQHTFPTPTTAASSTPSKKPKLNDQFNDIDDRPIGIQWIYQNRQKGK